MTTPTDADKDKLAPGNDDDALIAEMKERFKLCATVYDDDHKEALDDLKFLSGDQWPAKVKRERELDGRPCLTINKLPTFLHQVTNDQRQNVPGIIISPVDDDADIEIAEVTQGLIRHIEYSSNADIAYDTAVNSAAGIGFGYFRLVTDYCDPKSFDQDIRFKRIRNPFTVYFDPASEEPDGSDAQFVLITGKTPRTEFTLQWPGAKAAGSGDFGSQTGDGTNNDWLWADYVRVAEYYRIESTKDTLVQLPDGTAEYKSVLDKNNVEVPEGTKTRPTIRPKVMLYKATGLDVLERTEIKCKWIPVFPVYGDELDIDGKVTRSGLIRNAKDPARMYNFWMTSATEEVALRPKTPYIGVEGQFEGFEDDWNLSTTRSFPYLEYKPISLDGTMAPAPARQPMADIPSGMLAMAMHANDNIKATTGLFDSSLGANGSARSGLQERQQQRQGDMSNFHFSDNLTRTIRHAGRCIVSMIPYYYDGTRIVRIMGEDGEMSHEKVNQPASAKEMEAQKSAAAQAIQDGKQAKAIRTVMNDLTVGQYDVTVKAGPSYDTLRQQALDSMVEVSGKWPKLMDVAGDLVIKSMDWPGAEDISERVKRSIPPEIRNDPEEQDAEMVQTPQGPIPKEQVGPMLEQMNQQMQAMGAELSAAKSGIEKAKIDAASREHIAEINAVSAADVAELNGLVKLLVAKLNPPPVLAADVASDITGDDSRPAGDPTADQAQTGTASPTGGNVGQDSV